MRPSTAVLSLALAALLPGCSIRSMAVNKIGDALAETGSNFAADDDLELVGDAIPFGLKTMEGLLESAPRHKGLLLGASSGFVQYAYGWVQMEGDMTEAKDLARATELRERARKLFLRARDYGLRGLEVDFPGGLAYRAGAELVIMEFIQIGLSSVKTKLACSRSMMRSLPRFVNEEGRECLTDHLPPDTSSAEITNLVLEKGASWPVSIEKKTCLIDIAVSKEMARGHRVFLDYSLNPRGFRFSDLEPRWKERYRSEVKRVLGAEQREASPLSRLKEINPASIAWLKEYGIDLEAGDRIEIAPSIQHFQGGIKIGDEETRPSRVSMQRGMKYGWIASAGKCLLDLSGQKLEDHQVCHG